jgi:heavy metal sensor kinase
VIAWRSLELRLTLWYTLMLFAGYGVLAVLLWVTVRHAVISAVDDLLRDRAERLVELAATEIDDPEEAEEDLLEYLRVVPEGHLARIRDASGREVAEGDEEPVVPWPEGAEDRDFGDADLDGVPHRLFVRDVTVLGRPYRVLFASSLESIVLVRDRLRFSLLVATPLALLLCSGGGVFIARRALEPLDRLAETASAVTVGTLSSRIPVSPTGDSLERLERTFNDMLSRLESSVARIEQFTTDASHELRTPLSVIRTTAELALRQGRTEAEYRSDLAVIQEQSEHLTQLIDVLLGLARQGVENPSVPFSDVDLVAMGRQLVRELDEGARAKGLELRLEAPGGPVVVRGNEASLRRLVSTLLENALAHTERGGVTVSVHDSGERAEVHVADTGVGIPEEALGKIFERFYRVDPSRSRASGGLGLGLAIARRIADLHGAELTVTSRVGEGSRFTLSFSR